MNCALWPDGTKITLADAASDYHRSQERNARPWPHEVESASTFLIDADVLERVEATEIIRPVSSSGGLTVVLVDVGPRP